MLLLNSEWFLFLLLINVNFCLLFERVQSFVKRVANQANQQSLALAVQGIAFRSVLTGLLDLLSIPPNINLPSRLYSTAFDQHAGNFDLLYDNNGDFGSLIRAPDGVVEDSGGGPFSNVVTPENSPGRGGNNAGNGGQGGAGGG